MLMPLFVLSALLLFPLSLQQLAAPAPSSTIPSAAPSTSTIPAEAASMVNPVKPTTESQAYARKMYGYDCAMCHGDKGDGKGDLAVEQKLTTKNFTDPAALKAMTDGQIFYVIKNGEGGQMPGEADRAKTNDIWNMVILVRSFAKKPM